ncbi:MAG: hypothetical protein VKK59_06700 [Vampirovibrionales bacterium]|nr:hypothetical protein [Vampirovibrionales bacterium]
MNDININESNSHAEVIRVIVITNTLQLEGEIYLTRVGKSTRRLTALLHSDKDFLAMTDVTVCDRSGNPVQKPPFLQVNIKHIEALWPSDPSTFKAD